MRKPTIFQLNIGIGVLVWGTVFQQSLDTWYALDQIYLLILWGIAFLVPLSLRVTRSIPIAFNKADKLPQIIEYLQPIVLISTGLAILDRDTFGFLGILWFLQAGLIALLGVVRWLPKLFVPLDEMVLNLGFIYTVISGIWFFIRRITDSFMGFSGIIIPLTAAHFVFIGMGALVNIGLLGRHVRKYTPQYLRWYRIGACGAIISPALVAGGITLTEFMDGVSPLEVLAVILLAGSFVWLATLFLVKIRATIEPTWPRYLLTIAYLTLFLTMTLALGYSIGRFTDWWVLTIADMVMWHAWFNALSFAGLSLIGWNLYSSTS